MAQPVFDFFRPVVHPLSVPYQPSSETSKAAAEKARAFVGEQGERVLAWLRSREAHGGTQKEAHEGTGIERPSLAARFNALEHVGDIRKTTEKRGGCYVYRVSSGDADRRNCQPSRAT